MSASKSCTHAHSAHSALNLAGADALRLRAQIYEQAPTFEPKGRDHVSACLSRSRPDVSA